jgi:hypothetical protein
MAMDLVARLRLIDNMTAPLKRMMASLRQMDTATKRLSESTAAFKSATTMAGQSVTKLDGSIRKVDRAMEVYRDTQGRLRDSTGRFVAENKRAENSLKSLASMARSTRLAFPGIGTLGGIAAGYGVAKGAESFLTSALGGAAQYELAQVQIEALFGDAKKAKTYMDRMSAAAAASPILNEQEIFANSKSFIALTKDQKVLEDMWKVAEKLNAMDPAQTLEGAVLAIRELAGGDVQSLVERFELPRKIVNQWKSLPIDKQAKAMNKYLDSLGFNQKFLEKTGQTALKQWDRTQELISKGMRVIGQDALTKLKPALVQINDFLSGPKFAVFVDKAGRAISGMFEGLITAGREAMRYLDTHFFNNPAFQKLPTIESKVAFVIDDLTRTFSTWYDSTGSEQLKKATMRVTDTILDGLETAGPEIGKSALSIGARIASGMIDGFFESMRQSKLGTVILQMPVFNAMDSSFQVRDKVLAAINGSVIVEDKMQNPAKMLGAVNKIRRATIPATPVIYGPPAPPKIDGNHYHGIEYVPRDGYTARLHKGERVLTAAENREYSGGGGKGNVHISEIHIHAAGGDLTDGRVVERIAAEIAREIYRFA